MSFSVFVSSDGSRAGRPTALVIDDSMLFRRSMGRLLEGEGLRLVGNANGGIIGAELAISNRPSLIILDHNMPDLSGVECMRAIRDAGLSSKIIVCTSEITLESSQDYALLGAYAIFIKPIPLSAFRRVLRSCVDLSAVDGAGQREASQQAD